MRRITRLSAGLLAVLVWSCATGGAKRVADRPDPLSRMEILARILVLEDSRSLGDGAIQGFLQQEDPAVRRRAVLAAGRIGDPLAIPRLVQRLKDPEAEVRRAAAFALGLMGKAEGAPALLAALDDQDAATRGRASEALGRIGQPSAGPAIAAAFRKALPPGSGAPLRIRGDDPGRADDPWVELRLHLVALARLKDPSSLAAAAVADLVIANRTESRAEALAATLVDQSGTDAVRGVGLDRLEHELRSADVLFCATDATEPVVTADHLRGALGERERPILVVDVGMPRDVDPAAALVEQVELLDMADVAALTEANLAARRGEADAVRHIVDEEMVRFAGIVSAREVAPVVTALREQAEGVRKGELERFAARLDGLSPEQRDAVEALTKGMLAKLLHTPTVQLKDSAGSSRGDRLADSVRDLFDLG